MDSRVIFELSLRPKVKRSSIHAKSASLSAFYYPSLPPPTSRLRWALKNAWRSKVKMRKKKPCLKQAPLKDVSKAIFIACYKLSYLVRYLKFYINLQKNLICDFHRIVLKLWKFEKSKLCSWISFPKQSIIFDKSASKVIERCKTLSIKSLISRESCTKLRIRVLLSLEGVSSILWLKEYHNSLLKSAQSNGACNYLENISLSETLMLPRLATLTISETIWCSSFSKNTNFSECLVFQSNQLPPQVILDFPRLAHDRPIFTL